MTERESPFIDRTGKSLERPQEQWPPYVIPKEAIDLEIERLADLPAPNNGRRESYIAQPGRRNRAWVLPPESASACAFSSPVSGQCPSVIPLRR